VNYLSLDDPFTLAVFALAAVLMAGFFVGRSVNRNRTKAALRRLEEGMRSLGHDWTVRKLRGGAVRLQLTGIRRRPAADVIKTVTLTLVPLSREVLPTWIWEQVRGRSDLLALHVTLTKDPRFGLEIVDASNEMGHAGLRQARELGWQEVEVGENRLMCHGGQKPPFADKLTRRLDRCEHEVWRLALRSSPPHLLINAPMESGDREMIRLVLDVAKMVT
jgi:hypothetical protein